MNKNSIILFDIKPPDAQSNDYISTKDSFDAYKSSKELRPDKWHMSEQEALAIAISVIGDNGLLQNDNCSVSMFFSSTAWDFTVSPDGTNSSRHIFVEINPDTKQTSIQRIE